ncbi:protein of unknown function [Candidatus Hydrogenisulfobacillus filiaventi]|uniref:Uncharacterized protein n=1 Tax=Candidatus Hydrogenisulfobacillus filiaventi TaxID=2707344 RepID=A0A6F8ZG23_9FIRM|nr:protein of unknown function [Candidatus Hydrogenisulfobacillus filiaventi]
MGLSFLSSRDHPATRTAPARRLMNTFFAPKKYQAGGFLGWIAYGRVRKDAYGHVKGHQDGQEGCVEIVCHTDRALPRRALK